MILWALLVASTYNLVVMTLERHADLMNPMQHKASFTNRKAYASIAFPWLLGLCFENVYSVPLMNVKEKK